jgi:transposase
VDIDAQKTATILDLNRNTINKYFKLFREAIMIHQLMRFKKITSGTAEIDEGYFGAKRKRGFHGKLKRGRGTTKQPVFGIIKRRDQNGNTLAFTQIIPDCKASTLIPIIQGKIDVKTTIDSDYWKSYDSLVSLGYNKHLRVNHGQNQFAFKGDDGDLVSINGAESFWSFTKRRLAKFNGYREELNLHLKECEWRWNHSPPNKTQSKKDQRKYLLDLEQDLWYIFNNYLSMLKRIWIYDHPKIHKITKDLA